jgi:hypothetical protein
MNRYPARLTAAARRTLWALLAGAGLLAATAGPAAAGVVLANHCEPLAQAR